MGDTTPIPAPRRGLSGSANLTVLFKFAPDQPLLPWQRKFENYNRKTAKIKLKKITSLQQCVRAILIATNRKQQKSIWG